MRQKYKATYKESLYLFKLAIPYILFTIMLSLILRIIITADFHELAKRSGGFFARVIEDSEAKR